MERPAEVLPKSGSARVLMEQTPPIYPGRDQEGTLGMTGWDSALPGFNEEDRIQLNRGIHRPEIKRVEVQRWRA